MVNNMTELFEYLKSGTVNSVEAFKKLEGVIEKYSDDVDLSTMDTPESVKVYFKILLLLQTMTVMLQKSTIDSIQKILGEKIGDIDPQKIKWINKYLDDVIKDTENK